jgi:hypothetical protein
MKRLNFILVNLFTIQLLVAQSFDFESTSIPNGWSAVNGSLSLSTDHFKQGSQSLKWVTTGVSTINISFSAYTIDNTNSGFMHIFVPYVTNDTILVDFMYNFTVKRSARFLCNFRGWREFNRAYTEYASTSTTSINKVKITLKPSTSTQRSIYFDDVKFNYPTESKRIIGSHWILDRTYFKTNNSSLELFANPTNISIVTPTAEELSALNQLRSSLSWTPAAGSSTALNNAINYVQSLNIVRNADGSVRGNVINTSAASLTDNFMIDLLTKAEVLAADGLNNQTTLELFNDYVDHLLCQGLGEGCNYELFPNVYNPCRVVPQKLLNILPACTDFQKGQILRFVRWIAFYGHLYDSQSTYLSKFHSDIVYLFLPHMMGYALSQLNDNVAVRELKALKRYLERNTEYVPGPLDFMKPDGTSFHHKSHYNNYMYAYQPLTEHMYYFKGTPFKISSQAFDRFKKAVISLYAMGTLSENDDRYNANSLSGRNAMGFGLEIQYTKNLFEKLVELGGDTRGTAIDEELAAAYNYFFKSEKYSVLPRSYEGFYQFNYSPLGIYRRNNWVASMRAPTTKFFGAEIYDNENRFGRYQSHGALEIMYEGSLANSGYPVNGNGGGWNWNVVPGTTTVHYNSWQEMMPLQSVIGRFDQYTLTKNFAGALSWGDCGIFAADFDQIDTWWVNNAYTPTNLVFKKSMFAFENVIISLGSNIAASGNYSSSMITATNLFQNIVYPTSGSLILNGNTITKPYSSNLSTTQDNWMITPQGTGYFVPQGNMQVVLKYDSQATPKETGADYAAPAQTADAALAYINHGVKTSGRSYSFVVVPGTNTSEMQQLSAQMANNGGSIYEVHEQSWKVHAITYKPLNIKAYSFFNSTSNLSYGIIKACTAENLTMYKTDTVNDRYYFATCNPNLKPAWDAVYGWVESGSQATFTISGEWELIEPVQNVSIDSPLNGETKITVYYNNGEPVYFGIKSLNEGNLGTNWIVLNSINDTAKFIFGDNEYENLRLCVYDAQGQLLSDMNVNNVKKVLNMYLSSYPKGVLILEISNSYQTKTFKLLNK